jgi:uncharacterized protein YndB with AHSA1/START domain
MRAITKFLAGGAAIAALASAAPAAAQYYPGYGYGNPYGGIFRLRMVGPDGFDTGHGIPGCVLEVIEREKLVWTNALGPGYRPNEMGEGCESFPFTAVITFADAGNGKTAYKAIALHKDMADRDTHANMGFEQGWGTVAGQLEEFARGLKVNA